MTQKILIVSGTRPEIIKLALLYHVLKTTSWAEVCWVHTGQHDGMATQLLASFEIKPDHLFQRQGTSLSEFSQGCRTQLEKVMAAQDWSMVVVQGDTESAFLGALAGFYHQVPVAHVEAGLRTYRLDRPFPEEGIRQMISRISLLHFAPTQRAVNNLLAENIPAQQIFMTGNTAIDAQHWAIKHHNIKRHPSNQQHLLVTIHRRENWGHELRSACQSIATLARRYPEMHVLFPVHLNPAIQHTVHQTLGNLPNVRLTDPLDYLAMQQALIDAWLVLTDSGGLQEEAPTYGVPLLVLREETERPEAVESGCAQLVGTDTEKIITHVSQYWEQRNHPGKEIENPFGDGYACERITAAIKHQLVA